MPILRDMRVAARARVRLGVRTATIVGVLEPSGPLPRRNRDLRERCHEPAPSVRDVVTGRVHRMTYAFGRLAPGVSFERARAELRAIYAAMLKEHPEAYPASADFRIDATRFEDHIAAKSQPVLLLLLMMASVLMFVIPCANAPNLILVRMMRRERELAIRAALGATTAKLRRTLLVESVSLCRDKKPVSKSRLLTLIKNLDWRSVKAALEESRDLLK